MKHVSELAIISLCFIIEKQHLASRAYKVDQAAVDPYLPCAITSTNDEIIIINITTAI